MSLKKVNKKGKEVDSFSKKLNEVDQNIQELGKNSNLSEILKKYENTKNNIVEMTDKLKQIKQQFDETKKNTIGEKITDDTFEEYMEELEDDFTEDMNELDIELQVAKYKQILEKIKSCEKYLKDKKMEIITCKEDKSTSKNDSSDSSNSNSDNSSS